MFFSLKKIRKGFVFLALASGFSWAANYDLPLIFINSQGVAINQNNKIPATMRVLSAGNNTEADSSKGELFNIGIKIRGQTSASFPKKGYSVEIQNSFGEEYDAPLLQLPEGDDWVLHGPYVDKTLIRNALAHWLYQQTGRYSPRFRFTELFIDGQYKGVYLLLEKIKRGKYRLDISKLKETDVANDDVTGGYIWSIDKVGTGTNGTYGIDQEGFKSNGGSPIVLRYPKKENMMPSQMEYIKNFINSVETTCTSGDMSENGCGRLVDYNAATDYMLHEELVKNTDIYWVSFYMFKDKESKGGKLNMGAPWDFNLAIGAYSLNNGMDSTGWQIDANKSATGDFFIPKWVINIWNDNAMKEKRKSRWQELRSGVWHTQNIDRFIDSLKILLKNAAVRNFERWPNLGQSSGMNDPDPLEQQNSGGNSWGFGGGFGFGFGFGFGMGGMNGYNEPTWDAEIEHVRRYLKARIRWIDSQFNFIEPANPIVMQSVENENISSPPFKLERSIFINNYFKQYGNSLHLNIQQSGKFALVDLKGKTLYTQKISAGEHIIEHPQKAQNIPWLATLNGKMLIRN